MPYITELEELTLREDDKVKYVGAQTPTLLGKKGTVTNRSERGRSSVKFEGSKFESDSYPFNKNLALWTPDYQPGDIVRITPRDGTLAHREGVEGVVIHATHFEEDGRHRVIINSGENLLHPFARNISLITKGAQNEFKVSDVVRIGTEVGVLRALPDTPDGLYEVETMRGDTLYATRETMEKIT